MRLALDTNRYVDLRKDVAETIARCALRDDQTKYQYAALFRQLRKQGTPIPTNDLWLAALVLQHSLLLHARDKHFDHLPQLVRV